MDREITPAMTTSSFFVRLLGAALALVLVRPLGAAEPPLTQTFTLSPGWNAIHLEVAPNDPSPAVVFGGLANVDQVWAYFPTRKPVQYLSDPAAGLFNVPGWRGYFPAGSRPDAAVLSTLQAVTTHQSYLIKYNGSAATTLTVTGQASYRAIKWQPDGFTLTGLPLAPAGLPAGDYFFNSPAHKSQPRFRLDPNGTWVALTDASVLLPGRAYWIFSKGSSEVTSPIELAFDGVRKLDFGPDQETKTVTLRNRSAYATTVTLSNPDSLPLATAERTAGSGALTWTPLTSYAPSIPANGSLTVRLGARRKLLADDAAGLLRVSGGGLAFVLPVSIALPRDATVAGARPARSQAEGGAPANPTAGLWIGTATLDGVSEANAEAYLVAKGTPATFQLRLILHVDASGNVRLLKDVTLMRRRAPAGSSDPQPLVLVTDRARLPDFAAPLQRDGSPFAYRVSSVGYDFDGTSLPLAGGFGNPLSGNIVLGRTLPTNPFRHKYHPDHDDLGPTFQPLPGNLPPEQLEVWGVTRSLTLEFHAPAPDAAPGTGYSERSGDYKEVIQAGGLHRHAVVVTGNFTIRRVNPIAELNPAP